MYDSMIRDLYNLSIIKIYSSYFKINKNNSLFFFKKVQIIFLNFKNKAIIYIKYVNFTNIFLFNFIVKLLK